MLRQKSVDGLIVSSASDDARWVAALGEVPFSVLFADRQIAGLGCDVVQIDHERGGGWRRSTCSSSDTAPWTRSFATTATANYVIKPRKELH